MKKDLSYVLAKASLDGLTELAEGMVQIAAKLVPYNITGEMYCCGESLNVVSPFKINTETKNHSYSQEVTNPVWQNTR